MNTNEARQNKMTQIIQLLIIFVLPIFLFLAGIISVEYRLTVLAIVTVVCLLIVIKEKWSFKDFGLTKIRAKSMIIYLVFTVFTCLMILILAKYFGKSMQDKWWQDSHFLYQFLLISLAQEITYRSFLMHRLKTILSSPKIIISFNAFLFGFMHIIYPDPLIIFLLSFIAGLGFATIYYYYPNLILVSISHSAINFFSVLFCFTSMNC